MSASLSLPSTARHVRRKLGICFATTLLVVLLIVSLAAIATSDTLWMVPGLA